MSPNDPNVCPNCGKRKKPEFPICYDCSQQQRGSSGSSRGGFSREEGLPQECVFDTFYTKEGFLRPEIFLAAAEKAASVFENGGMSQTTIRSLFYMLKAMEQRLKVEKNIPQGEVNEVFLKFIRQVEYQTKRQVIATKSFKEWVDTHTKVVLGSAKEFMGFVEYLTSIVARIKVK
jgi:hypothetical protein